MNTNKETQTTETTTTEPAKVPANATVVKEVVAAGWSKLEEQVIAMYHESGGLTRAKAIIKMKAAVKAGKSLDDQLADGYAKAIGEGSAKKAKDQKAPAKAKTPKTAKPKTERKAGKYNRDLVIKQFMEGGKNVSEIAASKMPGLAGISKVYVYRILFGTENSGGVDADQKARRKEHAARVKAWAAERDAKEKK